MEGPINYNIDVKNPFEEYAKGLQLGNGIRQMQVQQAQEAQMAADMAALQKDPTPQAILGMSAKYPQLTKQLSDSFKMSSDLEQKSQIKMATPVLSAATAGRYDIAEKTLREQAAALKNSGREKEAEQYLILADQFVSDPKAATAQAGILMSAAMGPENFGKTYLNINKVGESAALAPYKLAEQQADTSSAMTEAAYADSKAQLTNANMQNQMANRDYGSEIKTQKLKLDVIDSERKRAKTDADIEKLDLEKQKITREMDISKKAYEAEGANSLMANDTMMGTIDKLLTTPKNVIAAANGPVDSRLPTIQQDVADYEELVALTSNQAFLAQLPFMIGKGAGSLSDAEGTVLKNSMANLSLRQSPEQMYKSLQTVKKLLTKGRAFLASKYVSTPTKEAEQQSPITVDY